ncbi:MAG: LysM peptidoglycan-binding domain-containing protein [Egibacteraceae bacterium]
MTRLANSFTAGNRPGDQGTGAARSLIPLMSWLAALAAAIAILILMGRSGLQTPSVLDPAAWPAWASGRHPLDVAFALLRLVGLAGAWYLLGVTTIGMVARLLCWGRLVRVADVLTVPWVRGLLQGALGLGLATAAVTGATIGSSVGDRGAEVALEMQVRGIAVADIEQATDPATMEQQPPPAIAPDVPAVAPDVPDVPAESAPADQPGAYEVQPGDHFWSIAERALADSWGRAPSDDEIVPYWQQLIEINRGDLVDPGNPDLILPGQTFTVPAPPALS